MRETTVPFVLWSRSAPHPLGVCGRVATAFVVVSWLGSFASSTLGGETCPFYGPAAAGVRVRVRAKANLSPKVRD